MLQIVSHTHYFVTSYDVNLLFWIFSVSNDFNKTNGYLRVCNILKGLFSLIDMQLGQGAWACKVKVMTERFTINNKPQSSVIHQVSLPQRH